MTASTLGQKPLEATPENIGQALQYLHSLRGEGGTMMLDGVKAALDFPHDPTRLRFVCFLTDGYIGNESEVLREIQQRLGPARIFSFGIGSAVNRYLLDQMAKAGRGAVAYLGLHDSAAQIMEDFFRRISHPALTDLRIDWGGLNVAEVFPTELPDLFIGRPVIVTGRFAGEPETAVWVNGLAASRPLQLSVAPSQNSSSAASGALPCVWARTKIAELASRSGYEPRGDAAQEIKQVALDYALMSPFTAFIAVDSLRRTGGADGTTVPVAVPVPEGVKYKTTVTPGE
jgi:Ca-activated chloride channel family protein